MSKYQVINPYTQQELASLEYTSKEASFKALEEVYRGRQKAFDMAPFERANILHKLAELMKRDKESLSRTITQEMGKTINDARIEMDRAIHTIVCSAEEATRLHGEVIHSDAFPPKRDRRGIVEYFPVGVVLAITPFNFPINLSVHKIGPAFAAGNTILFKPGPQNYLSAKHLTELCYEAGMTKDIIQLINPDIPVMSELVQSEYIHCISFTGGVVAAKAIARNAGIKKLLLELGGNDPLIVMPDGDVSLAVKTAVVQRFGVAGQRCTASKKVFLHESVYAEFSKLIIQEANKLTIGDPLKDETFVGPVVNSRAADEIMKRLDEAVAMGARVLTGHKREGNIIHPTVIENVKEECLLIKDETFGPVIPLIRFKDIDEVIEQLSRSSFGLQSGVFTNDITVVKKLFRSLDVGALMVNDGPGFRVEHFPFGGTKLSGLGREGVAYAIREMSTTKTLVL